MRVYKYYAEPASIEDAQKLYQQLKLAENYRRALLRIENAERFAVGALYQADPRIPWRERKLGLAMRYRAASSDAKAAFWGRTITRLSHELRELRKAMASTDDYKNALAAIRSRRGPMTRGTRGLYSEMGLFWGTYLLVEDAHDRACRTVPPWETVSYHGRWTSLAIQIQTSKTMTGSGLRACEDKRAQLGGPSYSLGQRVLGYAPRAVGVVRNKRGDVRPQSFQELRFRTGSTGPGNRIPSWTKLHVLTGRGGSRGRSQQPPRQIPDDAIVRWVRVHRERVALRDRWWVQIVVDEPIARSAPTGTGTVGIDIGWRRVDGGIRVAYAVSSRGWDRSLIIPDDVLRATEKADSLRAIRDRRSDQMRAQLIAVRSWPGVPAWYLESTALIHAWRKPGRLVRLLREIETKEWPFPWIAIGLDGWRRKDVHLLEWEANSRRRLRLRVLGRQRGWLADILRDHDVLGIEKTIRIDRLRSRDTADSEGARAAAVANSEVAPGMLRLLALQMAASRGIRGIEVDPHGTTSCCPECGAVAMSDRTQLVIRCEACGHEDDQDRLAAKQIRDRATAAVRDAVAATPTEAAKKPGRRNRKSTTATRSP